MSTKLKNEFEQILSFKNPADKAEHDSKILMFKFLTIIEEEMKHRGINKKDLARLLGTSPSYVTQLFRGNKTINLIKLAQLQELFELEFEIHSTSKNTKSKKAIRSSGKINTKTLVAVR